MKMLTLKEAAAALRISPGTARLLIKAGRLRAYRIERKYRIAEQDLLDALKPVQPIPMPVSNDFLTDEARLAPSARREVERRRALKTRKAE